MKTTPSPSAAAPSSPRPLSASKREHRESSRVAKKLKAGQPGTHKLLKVHGDALLCVRYRHDRLKLYRYTTIELIVDAAPIHRRRFDVATFGIHLAPTEGRLRRAVIAAGARWDRRDGLWWLRGDAIRTLDLVDRIRRS